MTEEELEWYHAGISMMKKDGDGRYVRVPDRIFRDEEILRLGHSVDWYFNDASRTLIITHNHLEKEDYEYSGASTRFTEGDSKYGLTVPKPFYDDDAGIEGTSITNDVMEKLDLPKDGFLHFVYHSGMISGTKESCYILTEEQFDKRFSDSDVWDGALDQVPKFF
ncbi:hypothetical protein GRX03_12310 [Halovenus sp. WSH3]|uniref:Uncharacterized protein n=1 Tax=Halovenus carboxidivorans TaxID=2692199 RepID=A0A6B0T9X8_9EURY|nr:hypothetical protein [Halovenus carboxidivorans]MXR52383.1 hypothetical protein [Halovenus carboxidivorans]